MIHTISATYTNVEAIITRYTNDLKSGMEAAGPPTAVSNAQAHG